MSYNLLLSLAESSHLVTQPCGKPSTAHVILFSKCLNVHVTRTHAPASIFSWDRAPPLDHQACISTRHT
jgi:hypothetical protein